MRTAHRSRRRTQQGNSLVFALVAITVILGVSFAFSSHVASSGRATRATVDRARAEAVAEAAVDEARMILEARGLSALLATTYPRVLRGVSYQVHVTNGPSDGTLDDDRVRLTALATASAQQAGAEVVLRSLPPSPGGGFFAKSVLNLESASKVDAYDSTAGSYSSQAVNTYDGVAYADADVVVDTNGDVELKSDSKIFGDTALGPTGWLIDDGSGYVSGSTYQSATDTTMPSFTVPAVAPSGALALSGGATMTIGPGTFSYDEVAVATGAELTIVGPATIICGESKTETDGKIWLDTTNGGIEYYATGTFQVKTDTPWATLNGSPVGVNVYLSKVGGAHKIETGAIFTGTIIAPDSEVVIQTTGDVFGAVMADTITMKTKAFVHVDKALGSGTGGMPRWAHVSANRMSGPMAEQIILAGASSP